MKKITLSLLVENTSGVLSRIAGLFSRRGYNIESISAGISQDPRYTRITVVASGDDQILEQIRKQIAKLVDVKQIITLKDSESVRRELVLVKVQLDKKEKQEVIAIADIFRANIVDVAPESLMMELTGNSDKIDAFLGLLGDFQIKEVVRTGITALCRGIYDNMLVTE